jgi:hypothetical protein
VLGESLVFMQGPGMRLFCKTQPSSFLKILFSYFQDLGRVSKICKKQIYPGFKALVLQHVIPVGFQSWFLHIGYYKFYYLKS